MVKKALNLQTLITSQKSVETMIQNTTYSIIASNPELAGSKGETINTVDLYEKLLKLYKQLNIIKLAKDKGNRKKTKLGCTNQELILERSNLIREKSMLTAMYASKLKSKKHTFQITKNEIDDKLIIIEKRLSDINTEMTNFNNSHTMKINIYPELQLL